MTARPSGRRPASPQKNVSVAEREIRAAQKARLDAERAVQDRTDDLAKIIDKHMRDGVTTGEIGTWLVTPRKPRGVTRQQVYKLVSERVDRKASRWDGIRSSGSSPS